MIDFIFDIEALDQVDSCIILSAAFIPVDFDTDFEFDDLVKRRILL